MLIGVPSVTNCKTLMALWYGMFSDCGDTSTRRHQLSNDEVDLVGGESVHVIFKKLKFQLEVFQDGPSDHPYENHLGKSSDVENPQKFKILVGFFRQKSVVREVSSQLA